jgi:hypothetical protein
MSTQSAIRPKTAPDIRARKNSELDGLKRGQAAGANAAFQALPLPSAC